MRHRFYKRDNEKLYLELWIDGKRKRLSTDIYVQGLEVKNNTVVGHNKAALEAKQAILDLEKIIVESRPNELMDNINAYLNPDAPTEQEPLYLADYIDEYLEAIKKGSIKSSRGRLSLNTIQLYKNMAEYYREYVGDKDIDVLTSDMGDATDKIRHIRKLESHFQGYINFLREEKEYKRSSTNILFSKLQAVLNYLEKKSGIRIPTGDLYVPKGVNKTFFWPEYFTRKVLAGEIGGAVDAATLTAMKIHILTAARPSDFLALREENFVRREYDGKVLNLVTYTNSKNNTLSSSPIPEQLYYKAMSNLQTYGSLLPHPNPDRQWYQRAIIRVITKRFDADNVMTEFMAEDQSGKVFTRNVPVSSETTPHTLRKAGTSLYRGLDRATLGKMTGHSADSKMPDKVYIGVSDAQFASVQDMQEKLIGH